MIRLWLAVWLARAVGWFSRMTGRGGSSLPGLVARRIEPTVLTRLASALPGGTMLVTGTNGKTTTAAVLRHILTTAQVRFVSNRAGSNLILGLTAAMVQASRWRIYPDAAWALLETDEATVPRAASELQPRALLVTNFFRDQLDRYGELSTTVQLVQRGVTEVRPDGFLVLNFDDPQVAALVRPDIAGYGFGLALPSATPGPDDVADARFCPQCGRELGYRRRYFAHLGHYFCPACQWQRPAPEVEVTHWDRERKAVEMVIQGRAVRFSWSLPGRYNLYNLAAAVAAGVGLGIPVETMVTAVETFRPAFGRMEQVEVDGHALWLALIKNPVGFNQVLATIAEETAPALDVLVMINDRYADGRDVSWLWDVDLERYLPRLATARWWVSGLRAWDMAVRLKYAGVLDGRMRVEENAEKALTDMVRQASGDVFVLPTYTAMLEIRQYLTQRGYVRHFREG